MSKSLSVATKPQVLKLYQDMMREAKKIQTYNFRTYALRRIKHGFTKNKNVGIEDAKNIFLDGLQSFDSLKRQVLVLALYKADKIVVENQKSTSYASGEKKESF